MKDDNKRNLQYFEATSMQGLFDALEGWQLEHKKRFLSLDIQDDHGKFCCIALTNPTEVGSTAPTRRSGFARGGELDLLRPAAVFSPLSGSQDRPGTYDQVNFIPQVTIALRRCRPKVRPSADSYVSLIL